MNKALGGVEEPSPWPPSHFRLGHEELTVYLRRHKMTLQSFKLLNNYRFIGSSKVAQRSPGTLGRHVNASQETELVFRPRQRPLVRPLCSLAHTCLPQILNY